MRTHRGFTLIEISIALAVLAVLLTMAAPVVKLQAQRAKESELRQNLREIRTAIDAYRQAVKDGRIRVPIDASGYPPSLDALVEGVPDVKRAQTDGGRASRLYFLRRVPADPMVSAESDSARDAPTGGWGLRSYASPPDQPAEGEDVFDVYSTAPGVGLNGVPYRQW